MGPAEVVERPLARRRFSPTRSWTECALIGLTLFLCLWRLDSVTLYRDEADTALVARSMVQTGHWIPRYYDGRQLIVHFANGIDTDERFFAVIPGWLQYYVEAAGFQILGINTWTARFPFALLGFISVWVLYRTGKLLFTGWYAFVPPLFAISSIFSLEAFRQARYYSLVYLFAALLLLEICRYIRRPAAAQNAWFFVRLGIWGLLLYLAHWGSFITAWSALSVFVLVSKDALLRRRWIVLSALLAIPAGAEFALVHMRYMLHSPVTSHLTSGAIHFIAKTTAGTILSVFPVLLLPAAIWIWNRPERLDPKLRRAVALAASMVLISIVLTIVLGREKAEFRYYLQILPAAVLLESVIIAALGAAGKPAAAALLAIGCLLWPSLSFRIEWSDGCSERQLLKQDTFNEPVIRYLRQHVARGDTVAVFPNEQGQPIHWYLPQAHWVNLLDSAYGANAQFRRLLPADAFDDNPNVDWFVVWHPPFQTPAVAPRMLSAAYRKVWEYSFEHPRSFWDAMIWDKITARLHPGLQKHVEGFEVWRKTRSLPRYGTRIVSTVPFGS